MDKIKIARTRYTRSEINTVFQYIQQSPTNLKYAFKQAAEKLGRSPKSIEISYYARWRKVYSNKITCGSIKGTSNNVKNNKRDLKNNPNDVPKQHLQPWLSVIHIYMDLPKEQQQALKTLLSTL